MLIIGVFLKTFIRPFSKKCSTGDDIIHDENDQQYHPSMKYIRSKRYTGTKYIRSIKVGETCQLEDIPNKNIKKNYNIFNNFACLEINHYESWDLNMLAQYMYIRRKKNLLNTCYILPNLSKSYENLINNKLYGCFDEILFPINMN